MAPHQPPWRLLRWFVPRHAGRAGRGPAGGLRRRALRPGGAVPAVLGLLQRPRRGAWPCGLAVRHSRRQRGDARTGTNRAGHLGSLYKHQLGWLPRFATVSSMRTVTLAPYETSGRGYKAIRLVTGPATYWREYRTRTGFDASLPAGTAGVQIRYRNGGRTQLLDAAPGTTGRLSRNAAVPVQRCRCGGPPWCPPETWEATPHPRRRACLGQRQDADPRAQPCLHQQRAGEPEVGELLARRRLHPRVHAERDRHGGPDRRGDQQGDECAVALAPRRRVAPTRHGVHRSSLKDRLLARMETWERRSGGPGARPAQHACCTQHAAVRFTPQSGIGGDPAGGVGRTATRRGATAPPPEPKRAMAAPSTPAGHSTGVLIGSIMRVRRGQRLESGWRSPGDQASGSASAPSRKYVTTRSLRTTFRRPRTPVLRRTWATIASTESRPSDSSS